MPALAIANAVLACVVAVMIAAPAVAWITDTLGRAPARRK